MFGNEANEGFIDPLAKPLDINSMNEKFVTVFGEMAEGVGIDPE